MTGILAALADTGKIVAVTVLTGFLGSGKTTLLNALLTRPDMTGTAVIVNEFGETPIDQYFVNLPDDDMVVLPNGCLCCLVRDDLEEALIRLTSRAPEQSLSHIVIETSGLADPGPVAQLVMDMPTPSGRLMLKEIVATIDSHHVERQLDAHPEARRQVAFADRLIFTKADLLAEDVIADARAVVSAINRNGVQELGFYGRSEPAPQIEGVAALAIAGDEPHASDGHLHAHAHGVTTCSLVAERPLEWQRFSRWFRRVRREHGDKLLRAKGVLTIAGEDQLVAVDAVHHVGYPPRRMTDVANGRSVVVLILQDLEASHVAEGWGEVLAA